MFRDSVTACLGDRSLTVAARQNPHRPKPSREREGAVSGIYRAANDPAEAL